ncbi:hypothetical protein K491DRAFT_271827 [Lophiostoma macrostomum CBS 122681]|uniref:Uncharacterized protein n=1 Tax=Lophiostoma macrostomum CBS 122681 TaxID=1314788 RepID=A0A6A6SJJ6_9PLEO|nr:hypothetical protein K491DRAFT_271827 [Lophiostoma macrostomum CBS 122681]
MTSENKGAAAEPAKVHTPDQIRKLEQSILELVRLVGPTSSVESYEGCPNTELRYTHTFQLKNDPPESPHSSGRVAKLMLYRTAITKSGNRLNIGPKVFWRIGGYTYGLALEYMEKAWSIKACEKRIKGTFEHIGTCKRTEFASSMVIQTTLIQCFMENPQPSLSKGLRPKLYGHFESSLLIVRISPFARSRAVEG